MVSKRDRITYEKIADLFSENNNRQKLREYMNSTKLPVIPYLGQYDISRSLWCYCMECVIGLCVDYSPFRTLLPDLWLVCRDATHHSDPAATSLATRATARTVQDCCPRFSVFSRPSTVVLVRRLSACLWFPTAPSPVIWFTVCRSTCTQHVWWPVLCYCGAACLELFAGWTAKLWLLDNPSGVWRHFYSGRGTTALCDAL